MRIWSLHPKYLDAKGLVALWRETLLAQAVLKGETKGYTQHPQLIRFKESTNPIIAINFYLYQVLQESIERGYKFNKTKCLNPEELPTLPDPIPVTSGQVAYEWEHLLAKLQTRDPQRYKQLQHQKNPLVHPLFKVVPGDVEDWEKL